LTSFPVDDFGAFRDVLDDQGIQRLVASYNELALVPDHFTQLFEFVSDVDLSQNKLKV
jgi:hypothetical protein